MQWLITVTYYSGWDCKNWSRDRTKQSSPDEAAEREQGLPYKSLYNWISLADISNEAAAGSLFPHVSVSSPVNTSNTGNVILTTHNILDLADLAPKYRTDFNFQAHKNCEER